MTDTRLDGWAFLRTSCETAGLRHGCQQVVAGLFDGLRKGQLGFGGCSRLGNAGQTAWAAGPWDLCSSCAGSDGWPLSWTSCETTELRLDCQAGGGWPLRWSPACAAVLRWLAVVASVGLSGLTVLRLLSACQVSPCPALSLPASWDCSSAVCLWRHQGLCQVEGLPGLCVNMLAAFCQCASDLLQPSVSMPGATVVQHSVSAPRVAVLRLTVPGVTVPRGTAPWSVCLNCCIVSGCSGLTSA